jgi:hypothetical protein
VTDDLGGRLTQIATEHLRAFERAHAPGFVLPRVFGGHLVDADTHADLGYTLSLVHAAGVERVGDVPVVEAVRAALMGVDASTNPFSSYRVAEALLGFGPFDDTNPLVAGEDAKGRERLAAACDATSWVPLLDDVLPRNYAVVLARCEHARRRLGVEVDDAMLAELLERARALFHDGEPPGFIDDSHHGEGRFDIYSADIHLFAEPLADHLGERWQAGLRNVLHLVEHVSARNGAAITWGRSTGALSVCMTIELGALAVVNGLVDDPSRWLGLVSNAADHLDAWFADGVITAHQYRSPYGYRGPHRRLQMTFDCLGKLVQAALALGAAPGTAFDDGAPTFPDTDRLLRFRDGSTAAVWAHRSRGLAFALPFVGGVRTDYLPAPVSPGLFEVPVDRDLGTGVPVVWRRGRKYLTAGVPVAVAHDRATLRVEHQGFPAVSPSAFEGVDAPPPLGGGRRATYRVEGRTLVVDEELTFEKLPDAVALQMAEAVDRPLRFDVETEHPHAVDIVDTAGLKEYRSFWGELPRVHQVDLQPASSVSFRWSVTPKLRVASSAYGHHYDDGLYRHLTADVVRSRLRTERLRDPDALARSLQAVDVLHMHWPEWTTGIDVDCARVFIDVLRACDVRIIWTMHNLAPHGASMDEAGTALYQLWAGAADVVMHHSEWGSRLARERYQYRRDAVHRVIPHLHWGELTEATGPLTRQEAERALDLEPCALRFGVVGAPRAEKDAQLVLEAFAATKRDDAQLLVCSLDRERVPDDTRIRALPYEMVPRPLYDQRLRCIDVFVLPFSASGMLTTGTVGDVVAMGAPALVSAWPYLYEALGGAAIPYGTSADDLTDAIEQLDAATVARAATASRTLQAAYAPTRVAAMLLEVLEELGTAKL